nr:MAG TPA: hypothetical protein [Caudoviricetes sp.]
MPLHSIRLNPQRQTWRHMAFPRMTTTINTSKSGQMYGLHYWCFRLSARSGARAWAARPGSTITFCPGSCVCTTSTTRQPRFRTSESWRAPH